MTENFLKKQQRVPQYRVIKNEQLGTLQSRGADLQLPARQNCKMLAMNIHDAAIKIFSTTWEGRVAIQGPFASYKMLSLYCVKTGNEWN